MHSHLKGRIFQRKGVNYLVLQDEDPADDYVLVRALNSARRVERVAAAKVQQYLELADSSQLRG